MARTSKPQPPKDTRSQNRYRPTKCRRCRRPNTEVLISSRGLCTDCAIAAVERNQRSMADKTGGDYARWVEGMARAIEEARSA